MIVNALPTDALSAPAVDSVLAAWAMQQRGGQRNRGRRRACARRCAWPQASAPTARPPTGSLAALKRDLGLPMITLPRIPTAEIGPAIIAELTPHLAEQIR